MAASADLSRLSIDEIAALADRDDLPPVEKWQPEREGRIDIRIARDGTWWHEGDPIRREALVRLFSTILRREPDGNYVLVTPPEKLAIEVEDAPFLAVEMKTGDEAEDPLAFRLNSGDVIVANAEHPLKLREGPDGPLPYLHIRGDMWARMARPVYYELMELALANDPPGISSQRTFFPLGPRP